MAAPDEAAEEREWGSVHTEVGDAVRALTIMLGLMRDIVAPVGQVCYDRASDPYILFSCL